jgi:hypothetical protein
MDRVAVEAEPFEVVASVAREAAPMREEVGHRDLLGRIGVGELESRVEIADARVPGDEAIAYKRRDHSRGDRLR